MSKRPKPADAWLRLSRERVIISSELHWIVGRSLDVFEHLYSGASGFPEVAGSEGSGVPPFARAVAERFRAEMSISSEAATRANAAEVELRCLLQTLLNLVDHHNQKASVYREIACRERRGRPKKVLMGSGRQNAAPKKVLLAKRGRPLRIPISDSELLQFVEDDRRRQGHISARKVLRRVAIQYLEGAGALPTSEWRRTKEVNATSANLEKRLSALHSKSRKLGEK